MSVGEAARLRLVLLRAQTHHVAGFRYDGGCDWKNAHASLLARNSRVLGAVEADALLLERVLVRTRDVALVERALTGGATRPSATSSWKRAMFLALQMLRPAAA